MEPTIDPTLETAGAQLEIPSDCNRPEAPAPRSTFVQIRRLEKPLASYSPFRESFFYDPRVNTALQKGGRQPDRVHYARESKRMWTTQGPYIDPRLPRTTVKPGTAFQNACLSADQLYSSSRNTLGYEVHRSLRGTSLCSTTKRFNDKSCTPEGVGPGSYDVDKKPRGLLTAPPPKQHGDFPLPDRLAQWGGRSDSRSMDSAGEWKTTSEKPSPTHFSFRKAQASTWIEQVEQRQRRETPLAQRRRMPDAADSPEKRLPPFLQGTSNPVHTIVTTKSKTVLAPAAVPTPTVSVPAVVVQPLVVSLYPPKIDDDDEA